MKLHQPIISALILGSISFNTFADDSRSSYGRSASSNNNNYMTITGSLGYRYSDDLSDADGQKIDLSSDFSQSIALGWAYERNSEGELLFSNSRQNLTIESDTGSDVNVGVNMQYLHVGGRLLFTDNSPFSTSIGLGVGGTFFNPSNGYDSELKFSGNISGGIRYQLNQNFALRGDLRVFGTVLSSDSNYLCIDGNCLIDLNGNMYVQTELMAGLEYKF